MYVWMYVSSVPDVGLAPVTLRSRVYQLSQPGAPLNFLNFLKKITFTWLKNLETIQRISVKNLLPSFLIFFLLHFQSLQITSALLDRVFQSFFIYMQIKMNIFIFFLFAYVVY